MDCYYSSYCSLDRNYESQYEDVVTNTQTVTQDSESGDAVFTGDFNVGD